MRFIVNIFVGSHVGVKKENYHGVAAAVHRSSIFQVIIFYYLLNILVVDGTKYVIYLFIIVVIIIFITRHVTEHIVKLSCERNHSKSF